MQRVFGSWYGPPAIVRFGAMVLHEGRAGLFQREGGWDGRLRESPQPNIERKAFVSVDLATERSGVITWKGTPITLQGPEIKAGDKAPDFRLAAADLSPVTRDDVIDHGKRAALLIVVPSLDTGVCSIETAKFSRLVAALPAERLKTYAVSMDLPFAQKRWCVAETVSNIDMLSDYREHSFGFAYGVRMKERGLLARSIFIISAAGTIQYTQLVPDGTHEPDYDSALAAARSAAGV
jgi:thioredoxin-dependent peroxiredoxin